jgi:nucleoside-diphosphate-sugar epimerase
MKTNVAVVCGAGGFIGGYLVKDLLQRGYAVRGVDIKPFDEWWQLDGRAANLRADLSLKEACYVACSGAARVYNLAADMGGMGFIEANKGLCMLNVLINTHLLMAAREYEVERYFYASSACVYAADKQKSFRGTSLKEDDAYPAMPEDGYGWEKLFGERMCRHFTEDFGLETRIGRLHNVYGPHGTWKGGREKAPAAICRKVAQAQQSGHHHLEVWGDGRPIRSFMWIGDCIHGINLLTESDVREPLNIGSSEAVSIRDLVSMIERIAGFTCTRTFLKDKPKGVNGRTSDNSRISALLNWAPETSLHTGLKETYAWIWKQVQAENRQEAGVERTP